MNDNKNMHSDDADLKDLINDYGSDEELRRKINEMKKQKEEQVSVQQKGAQEPVDDVKKVSSMQNITVDDVEKTMIASRGENPEETLVIMDGKKNSYNTAEPSDEADDLGKTIVRPLHEIQEEDELDLEEEDLEDEEDLDDEEVIEEVEEEEDEEVEERKKAKKPKKAKKNDEQKNKIITGVIIAIIALLIIGGIIFGVTKFMGKDDHKKPDDKVTDVKDQDNKKEDVDQEDVDDHNQSQDIAAKISALTKQKETYIIEKTKAEERLASAQKDLDAAKAELKVLDKDLLPKSKQANKAVDQYLKGEYKEANEAYQTKKKELDDATDETREQKQAEYEEALERHNAAVAEFNRLSEEASSYTTDYHEKSNAVKAEIDSATKLVGEYKSTISTLEDQIDDIELELKNLQ